tara:strand:- start:840 stop:3050 length:2211 start_codon:yes stop_codon:yes gene_type:complete
MLEKIDLDAISRDLAPFSDLGTPPPRLVNQSGSDAIQFFRNGELASISRTSEGQITFEAEGKHKKFASLKSMLASEIFADLRSWAKNQELTLANFAKDGLLPMRGLTEDNAQDEPLSILESFFDQKTEANGLSVVLFDGPAGIGKTTILQRFAYERASSFATEKKSLVLHLQSKGKMLQNIFDLIAMNLQVIRSSVTFDQIPVLVKHGLVTMVIDGFDELGDPNGYELAWAQLNEFLFSVKGEANIVLSGRETFVSKETMLKSLPVVVQGIDNVLSLTLLSIEVNAAKRWLRERDWTDEAFQAEHVAELLANDSFALRPFFLKLLAEPGLSRKIIEGEADALLTLLMSQLLAREATKFGDDTDRLVPKDRRETFVHDLMVEVARDLAENQTDSISATSLSWLSDVSSDDLPEEVRGILRNRANVIAFLTEDIQPNRVRFFHECVFYYWLAQATFGSLLKCEIPKYIRRNILNADFLDIWNTVCVEKDEGNIDKVYHFLFKASGEFGTQDRTKRNIFALACSMASIADSGEVQFVFSDITIEELVFRETVSSLVLKNVFISQLDIRGADVSDVEFQKSQVHSAIVDVATKTDKSFPLPTILVNETGEVTNRDEIRDWQFEQNKPDIDISELFKTAISQIPELVLLQRIARFRRYWIKDDESDPVARKILSDEHWPILSEALLNLGFMVASNSVAASGRPSTFYHLKKRNQFLNTGVPSDDLVALMSELIRLRDENRG